MADPGRLRAVRTALLSQRRLRGRAFCEEYADAVDAWLRDVFAEAAKDASGVALIAVGGYGRRLLSPGSDLDLVLVHHKVRNIDAIADALWYPIWNAGIHLDHSVRTPRETLEVVRGDIKSALSILNGRVIAGDAELGARVLAESLEEWAAKPRVSLERLRATLDERWAQHGELAFLLEPDVKLARGGLRDVEALRAAALAAPIVSPHLEDPRIDEAADELLALRVALHATTARKADRLLIEDSDAVARKLGYADADELLPNIAAAARRVTWATDQIWRRIDAWLAGPRALGKELALDAGIVLRDDELTFEDEAMDSAIAFRLAAASARSGIPIAPEALARLEQDAEPPPEPWPTATRDALIDLLGCGHAAVPLLETLDHLGVLGRYIREWRAVRSKPQRNVYHRYTVDRHLFESAAEAAALTREVHRPDLLLVAAWLHDLGKGFPGDHTDVGAALIDDIARRMGFDDDDVALLGGLVQNHLLLADTAMRRDLGDPATTSMVAARVRTVEELDLLRALTQADSIATGPAAWGAWKATLIEELVLRCRGHLAGEYHELQQLQPTDEQRALMSKQELRVIVENARVTVVAPDRPGLLAIVAGVFAVNRLSVRSATGLSEGGMAVEVFDIDGARAEPDPAHLEEELARAFTYPAELAARLLERSRAGRLPIRPGAARVAAPRVIFDNEATPRATIVEVRAPDGVGVLARIAHALARCGCDITVARVLTLGHEVVDTFYVTGGSSQKIVDEQTLASVERAILAELGRPDPEP